MSSEVRGVLLHSLESLTVGFSFVGVPFSLEVGVFSGGGGMDFWKYFGIFLTVLI